jgi:hypothetical protein
VLVVIAQHDDELVAVQLRREVEAAGPYDELQVSKREMAVPVALVRCHEFPILSDTP